MTRAPKKIAVFLIKISLIGGIFAILIWQAAANDAFGTFWNRPKNWSFLLLAVLCNLFSVSLTFIRWQWLVCAMDIPLKMRDAFRMGFVGFLFNLAPAGIVSGDLIKIIMLARRTPEFKERAAASVVVDRVIGLYIMFLTAMLAIVGSGFYRREETVAQLATQIMIWMTVISTVGIVLALLPSMTQGRFRRLLARLPWGGVFLVNLVNAFQLYRSRPMTLFISALITLPVHVLLAFCVYCVAHGLFAVVPTAMEHQVMHPVANLTSLIPLPAGPYEAVLNELYPVYMGPAGVGIGLIVAIGYRFTCIVIAGLGGLFYLAGRDEFSGVVEEMRAENA